MKEYLEGRGYRLPLDRLKEAGVPAIVLIDDDGYHHFVVVKGAGPQEVLLSDPAKGLRMMDRRDFEKQWNGILFVIRNRQEAAAGAFNSRDEWALVPPVSLSEVIQRRGVAPFTLLLPPSHDLQGEGKVMLPKLRTQLVRGMALALLAAALPVYGESSDQSQGPPDDPRHRGAEPPVPRRGRFGFRCR